MIFLTLLIVSTLAWAQIDTATLSGVVMDSSSAAVAGAKINVKNVETGQERSTTSGSDGGFTVVALPAGRYEVTVDSPGFAVVVQKGVVLTVGSSARITITLQVKPLSEKLVVQAATEQIDLTHSAIGELVDSEAVENLPLNGRDFMELAFLLPGNSLAPSFDPSKARAIEVSSLGNLGRGTNTTVDGLENNDSGIGGVAMNYTEESIQEFQVLTGRFSAEVGRAGFNALNIITKSGTDDWHGDGFLFFRDDALQAKGPFGTQKPPFDREQFGGSIGGPLIRDKLFGFFALERNRENGATTAGTRDTTTQQIVQSFASTPFREYLITGKGDWIATAKDSISLRISLQQNHDTDPGTSYNGLLQDPSNFENQQNHFYQGVASWARILSPTVINGVRVNFLFSENQIQPLTTASQVVFPDINVGANFRADQNSSQHRFEVKDDLAWNHGHHSLKFGGDYSHLSYPKPSNFDLYGPGGLISVLCDFPGQAGCLSATTDSEIPVAFAAINQLTLSSGFPGFGIRGSFYVTGDDTLGAYAQDDWQVRPNLTLNLGVRYEYDNDYIGKHQVNQFTPGPRSVDKLDFGPRLGFVWAPGTSGRTSIRGGYGIYFDHNVIETRDLELLLNGVNLPIVESVGGCTLANPFCNILPGGPPSIQVTSNNLHQPYVHQFSGGFQRQIGADMLLTADYIGTRGRRFQRQVEVNLQENGSRLNPAFGSVVQTETIAPTTFDGLLLTARRRFAHNFQFLASYTLLRSIDEDNDLLGFISKSSLPPDPSIDRGPAPNESRQRFVLSGIYSAPWGIQFSPILTTYSSVPVEIVQNHDFSEGYQTGFYRLPGLQRNAGNRQVHNSADINAAIDSFNANPALVSEHGGPIAHVAPGISLAHDFFSLDFRLVKQFTWSERYRLEVGGEAFNIANHINIFGIANTNFAGLQNNVESPNFGQPLGVTPGGVFGTGGPRAFQLVTKFYF